MDLYNKLALPSRRLGDVMDAKLNLWTTLSTSKILNALLAGESIHGYGCNAKERKKCVSGEYGNICNIDFNNRLTNCAPVKIKFVVED